MSIWCSHETIGFDRGWIPEDPQPLRGQVRSFCTGWSNHYPTTDGEAEQEASVDTAHIAAWCVPGHRESTGESEDGYLIGPWLRLSVDTVEHDWHNSPAVVGPVHASVVMDEDAVRALRDDLTEWLDRPKLHPTDETAD